MKNFSVVFDDIAEGRVRLFAKGKHIRDVRFDTYGQALRHIEDLRERGYEALSPNVEAVEALLRTAELYHKKAMGDES